MRCAVCKQAESKPCATMRERGKTPVFTDALRGGTPIRARRIALIAPIA